MSYRDRKKTNWKMETLARMCAMLALTDALYLLRVRPLASGAGDIAGLNLTWDSVLVLSLIGLMMMVMKDRKR